VCSLGKVSNPWLEAALSLLPSKIYNWRPFRQFMHLLLDFAIPLYTVLQV
jgi:hypothetical protein